MMSLQKVFYYVIEKCLCTFCQPVLRLFLACNRRQHLRATCFLAGFALGQAYHCYLLKNIPFPYHIGSILSLVTSVLLGIGNAISIQIRCISLLIFPIYCGKTGRGVLKAVILTYVVAGPITNMGLNAKEVVRVFACTTQLSYNLSKEEHNLIEQPVRDTALELTSELDQLKDALSSVRGIIAPIEYEIENEEETKEKRKEINDIDDTLNSEHRSDAIENKIQPELNDAKQTIYQKAYEKKLAYRCEHQISQAVLTCLKAFSTAYQSCYDAMPGYAAWMLCWPLKLDNVCSFMENIKGDDMCDSRRQLSPGLGIGYVSLKNVRKELSGELNDIKLQYKVSYERELFDIQNAKDTGERVMHAFEEKTVVMRAVLVVLNICLALLFLRIVVAAATYHDSYLTSIGYDNVYITGYFKELDERRRRTGKFSLLPLKKVERIRYIDIHTINNKPEHSMLTQSLKVMLEVVTATTFVMLDRLFYEALDVVRQYAKAESSQAGDAFVDIEVEGTGMLATLLRKLFNGLNSKSAAQYPFNNRKCLPKPRAMQPIFYFKIYGGYVWILMLLYINPYTLRLRRLICSYFYPSREKQRILHLYNDILKKRMKMEKTLRRRAVQTVRAHYLSAENLLSLRMKFPQVLGWLRVLPAARMTCLICGEIQPRDDTRDSWHSCRLAKCPFVCCGECWREAGARCLACDPSLAELSDVDSITDDDLPAY